MLSDFTDQLICGKNWPLWKLVGTKEENISNMSYISSSGNTVQLTLATCGYPIIQYSTLLYFFLNNYPKYLILSKNWDGFSKFRHFKNEIKSEEKKFFWQVPQPKKNFRINFVE